MGFSPIDATVSLAVLLPSVLMLRWAPRGAAPPPAPRPLIWVERAGQALCLTIPALTAPGRMTGWWAAPAVGGLVLYYALWARYLAGGRAVATLYRPLGGVPVPMAIVPVAVFLATAAWLGNPWIAVAAVALAAGHVPASLDTARALVASP